MPPGTDRRPFRADAHALRRTWATSGRQKGLESGDGGSARGAAGARAGSGIVVARACRPPVAQMTRIQPISPTSTRLQPTSPEKPEARVIVVQVDAMLGVVRRGP